MRDQVGGRGCQDQLGSCDWSHGEEALGAGDNQQGRKIRGAKEGVAECQSWSCMGQERREACLGTGNNLCKDLDMGREQEDRKKFPVARVPRAVRRVNELGWSVLLEPGLALQLREVACILRPEYSCSQELCWGAGLRGKAGAGSPRPGVILHSWASRGAGECRRKALSRLQNRAAQLH